MRAPVLLACLLVFSAEAAGKRAKKAPPPPPPVLTAPSEKLADAMGSKAAEMLAAATKFEIARTSYTQGIRPAPDKAIGSDFQRESAWKELPKAEVEKFKAIFYDEKSFRLAANVSGCNFVPDVVFQLTSASLDTQQRRPRDGVGPEAGAQEAARVGEGAAAPGRPAARAEVTRYGNFAR
ncbi:MAG: hypothetical protein H6Q89_4198 [Myxococcaceae bacterium]|nr:hypothetical protein [Myxococcaceae bacterium]